MTRLHGYRRLLATLFLPLLAATLACNALSSVGKPVGAPLTQAAATITAAANKAATALAAAPTAAPLPTQPPTTVPPTTVAATVPSSPTVAPSPTVSAVTNTPAAAATVTVTAVTTATAVGTPGGAVVLDPCTLLTTDQVNSLTNVAMGAPKPQNGGCLTADAATGMTSGVVIYALPASQASAFLDQYVPSLRQGGVSVDPTLAAKLSADTVAGDTVAAVNDLIAITVGQPKYNAKKVDGLGSAALWSWNGAASIQEGLLISAKPGALVALVLVADLSAKEATEQPLMEQLVTGVLEGLPPSFTVAGLQVTGSAPALGPCSLAQASDIDPILGTQSEDGVVDQGACNFLDVATHNLSLRVFALPAGVTAENTLNLAALTVLVGNKTAQDKVAADLTAGDLVAAVTDMGAGVQSGPSIFFQATHGIGDTGFLEIITLGSNRIGYFLAAKPGVLIGIDGKLGPGDNAKTSGAAQALLARIMTNLPDKFTVNGVP